MVALSLAGPVSPWLRLSLQELHHFFHFLAPMLLRPLLWAGLRLHKLHVGLGVSGAGCVCSPAPRLFLMHELQRVLNFPFRLFFALFLPHTRQSGLSNYHQT